MHRFCATLALLGYLLGGMFLPATHRHDGHQHTSQQHVAGSSGSGSCHHHADAAPAVPASTFPQPSLAAERTATASDCGLCLLCQVGSQVFLSAPADRAVQQVDAAAPVRLHRHFAPRSQRRTIGYLRGPPLMVS